MSHMRNYKIEMDYLKHQPPIRLAGGRIDRVGVECQEAVLTVPVRSLAEIEPFRYYDVVVRRHFPPEVLGLPLKVKILGAIALEPRNYIGYGRKGNHHHHNEHEGEVFETLPDGECVEVIEERIPAQIFDATMFGFGNAAMVDDIVFDLNTPRPFIRFYVNDKGDFVVMPCDRERERRPCRLIVKRTEIIREPFRAHTMAINRTATPFVHPQRFESNELWTQGNFGCGCPGGGWSL